MNDLTNSVAEAPRAVLMGSRDPASPVFYVVDGLVYFVMFQVLLLALRICLRKFAREEADTNRHKTSFVGLLVVVAAVAIVGIHRPMWMKCAIGVAAFLCCAMILKKLCWVPARKALLILLVAAVSGGGLSASVFLLTNRLLPQNRVTLGPLVRNAMGLADDMWSGGGIAPGVPIPSNLAAAAMKNKPRSIAEEFSGKGGDIKVSSNITDNAKTGLKLEAESMAGAIQLLMHPESFKKMVAGHNDDLKDMGLLADGKEQSDEELAKLGADPGKQSKTNKALALLENMGRKGAISGQDIKDLTHLLKTTHTNAEAAADNHPAAVHESASEKAPLAGLLDSVLHTGGTGTANAAVAPAPAAAIAESSNRTPDSITVTVSSAPQFSAAEVKSSGQPSRKDPLASMPSKEREAWLASQDKLHMGGVFKSAKGTLVIVNGQMVRAGSVVQVESEGRMYVWKLVEATESNVNWEPEIQTTTTEVILNIEHH